MTISIEKQVISRIRKRPRGTLFFVSSFIKIANAKAINKALERLTNTQEIYRMAQGIYVYPIYDKHIGQVLPAIEDVAVAIAKRDKATIVPTGSYAMYKLGLTTQVPLNIVYYTDTSARKISIGKQTIIFKKASSKNLAFVGEISKLVIQALRSIGINQASLKEIKHLKSLLASENSKHLKHDLELAPAWIRKLLSDNEQ
jgi:hypothetical protein